MCKSIPFSTDKADTNREKERERERERERDERERERDEIVSCIVEAFLGHLINQSVKVVTTRTAVLGINTICLSALSLSLSISLSFHTISI